MPNFLRFSSKKGGKISTNTPSHAIYRLILDTDAKLLDNLLTSYNNMRDVIDEECSLAHQRTPLNQALQLFLQQEDKYLQQELLDVMDILLKHGADPNKKDPSGYSLSDYSNVKILSELLKKHQNCEPSISNNHGP